MTLVLLIEIALKASLVAGFSLALVLSLKRLPAARRAAIAHLGLLAAAAMPLLVLVGPDLELAGFWSRTVADVALPANTTAASPITAPTLAGPVPAVTRMLDAGDALLLAWAAGAALLILGLGIGLARLFRLQQEAAVLTDRDWLGALAQAQHRMGVKQGTALLRSERLASPVSWGLLRPTIVLSPAALSTPDRAEAILAHELAHVVRMDWLNLLVARIATALFWFNPLVWLLAWQAHELREEAADDVVLRGEVDGPDYASLLVAFARGESGGRTLAAHGVAPGKGSLKRRLLRVLDGQARREPAGAGWIAACALAAAGLAAPLAAFTPIDRVVPAPVRSAIRLPASLAGAPASGAPIARPDRLEVAATAPSIPAGSPAPEQAPAADRAPANAPASRQQPQPARRLSPEALGAMRLHGVTPEWIADLESELPEVRRLSADQLTGLAIHGVTSEWVRSLRELGYGSLSYNELTSMAVHGVGPAYIRDLASAGYRDLSVDQLVGLKIRGVDSAYIRRMEAAGLSLDPDATPASRRRRPPGTPTPPSPPSPPMPPPAPGA